MTWKYCTYQTILFSGVFAFLFVLFMTTQVNAEISISERNSLLRSFQNLAILDANSAVDVWAVSDLAENWKRDINIFDTPQMSAAFLAPAMAMAAPDGSKEVIGGFFNPWINAVLMLKIEKSAKAPQVTAINLKLLSDKNSFVGKDPDSSAKILLNRFKEAQKQLKAAGNSWKEYKKNNFNKDDWQNLKARLESEIKVARGALAPDGDKNKTSLREAFGLIMDDLKSGGDLAGLTFTGKEPQDWKQTLLPVHVSEFDSYPVVILASRGYPLSFLWMQIDGASAKPVKRNKIFHIPMKH